MKISSDKKIIVPLFIVTFLIAFIPAFFLDTTIFTDETGVLGNAAALSGYNWETLIRGNGSYYKYGQSLLYYPLFLIFSDSSCIFKGIEIINALLVSCITPICYVLINKCFHIYGKKAVIGSFLVGILPFGLLISKYAWAESVLLLIPWLVLLFTVLAYESNSNLKKVYSFLVAFSAGYAFMSHQRGIVIVIAIVLTFFLIRVYYKKSIFEWKIFFITIAFMLLLDTYLSSYFKEITFGNDFVINANTLSSSLDFNYLSKIFTPYGFWILIKGISGWLFALTVETYGLVLLGVFYILYTIIIVLRDKAKEFKIENVFYIFSFLCFAGAFAMGILFFYKAIYMYYLSEEIRRADRLIYTRYVDSVLGPICLIAILKFKTLPSKIQCKTNLSLAGIFALLIAFFQRYVYGIIDGVSVWLPTLLGVGFSINSTGYEQGFVEIENLSFLITISAVLGFVIFLVTIFLRNKKVVVSFLISIFLSTYVFSFYNLIYKVNHYFGETVKSITNITDSFSNINEKYKYIYCDSTESDLFRESLQFYLKDYQIIRSEDLSDPNMNITIDNMFIFSKSDNYNVELYENDFYEIIIDVETSDNYKFYFKGEELNRELREIGIRTNRIIL